MTLQIVRDWVLKFNAIGPDGLLDRWSVGPSPKLTDAHRQALAAVIEAGPAPGIHGVIRWRLVDLCQWLWEEFRTSLSKSSMSRVVRALGYGWSAFANHDAETAAQNETI